MKADWRDEARRLRSTDPQKWTYRALGRRFSVSWSTVRRALEPKVKAAEKARARAAANQALTLMLKAAFIEGAVSGGWTTEQAEKLWSSSQALRALRAAETAPETQDE